MRRLLLGLEYLLLFLLFPLIYYFELIALPKLMGLLIFTGIVLVILFRSEQFSFRDQFSFRRVSTQEWRRFLGRVAIITPAIIVFCYFVTPDSFLLFPREAPQIWLLVMLFYPLFSAIPQELIYRGFFFARYKTLFKNQNLILFMSALSFGYLHIIYDSFISIGLTFLAGLIWAKVYQRTNSLLLVILEHALYGALGFTFGLGEFFYEGER